MIVKDLSLPLGAREEELWARCSKLLRAPCKDLRILKKSIDARNKRDIRFVYTVECDTKPLKKETPVYPQITKPAPRVVVAGAGPCGLFCALTLIRHGIKPLVVERGKKVEERKSDVMRFFETGILDTESNVQFGEGGAGTFSDGKLNTQTNTPEGKRVAKLFVEFGAPEEVGYLAKPHVGSDHLGKVVQNLRNYILSQGGEFAYSTLLSDLEIKGGKLTAVYLNGERREVDHLVLAIGHSARDTFEMLLARGLKMERKDFAVGVRIEHLQEEISKAQYGEMFRLLPAADYKLVSHAGERAAFTFCMCPGGVVIPSASEEGGVVTNGMSDFARAGKNANSALIVQVGGADFGDEGPLAGVKFQRKLERAAFLAANEAGKAGYRAPVQLVGDFLENRESTRFGKIFPTYARGTAFAPMRAIFPTFVTNAMQAAIMDMGNRLKGFSEPDAVLTGVESRTSSPLRILRGETLESVSCEGIYPCGEGCGYAGGITSAAADGIRAAEAIVRKYL